MATMLAILKASGYGVRNVKMWRGSQGHGWQCTLTHHGLDIAEVTDEGGGGAILNYWKGVVQERTITALIASADPVKLDDDFELPPTVSLALAALVDDFEAQKSLRRTCAKSTVFRAADGALHKMTAPYSPELAIWLRKRHPDLIEILNETIALEAEAAKVAKSLSPKAAKAKTLRAQS